MKQFLYFLTLLGSVGTIGLVTMNPKVVHQGASLLGLAPEKVELESAPELEEEQLAKFLSQYPYSAQNETIDPFLKTASDSERPAPPIRSESNSPAVFVDPPNETAKTPAPEPPKPAPIPVPVIVPVDPFVAESPKQAPSTPAPVENSGFARSAQPSNEFKSADVWGEMPSPFSTSPPKTESVQVVPIIPIPPVAPVQQARVQDHYAQAPPETLAQVPQRKAVPVGGGIMAYQDDYQYNSPNSQPIQPMAPPPVQQSPPQPPVQQPVAPPVQQPVPPLVQQPVPPIQQPPVPNQWELMSVKLETPQQPQAPVSFNPPPPIPSESATKISSQFQVSPSVMAEEVPCYGTEMVARVGTQVILMCDLLPQLRRMAMRIISENLEKVPEEKRKEVSEEEKDAFIKQWISVNYPQLLQEQINLTLIYNDFVLSKKKEEIEFYEKKLGEEFDQNDVPEMMKEFKTKNIAELKRFLKEELGSSLDRERMLTIRAKIAQQWIMFSVKEAEGECTHDEMMEYYTQHKDEFETKARVKWNEMVVLFSNFKTEKEAWDKIVWMGNQVAGGAPFANIAKDNSDGFTASKGGVWDWTGKGSLASKELEDAIFSLPSGRLSQVIKGEKGFHIVQVIQREEDKLTPFIDAQVSIREKIKLQRRKRYHDEYYVALKNRYPIIILREQIDFNPVRPSFVSNRPTAPK